MILNEARTGSPRTALTTSSSTKMLMFTDSPFVSLMAVIIWANSDAFETLRAFVLLANF
jgi:hypothetical protein